MPEFASAMTLNIEVPDRELRDARREIESELGDITVNVDGQAQRAMTDGGVAGRPALTRRWADVMMRMGSERNRLLGDIADDLDDLDLGGGGGGGLGTGVLLGRIASGGGGSAAGGAAGGILGGILGGAGASGLLGGAAGLLARGASTAGLSPGSPAFFGQGGVVRGGDKFPVEKTQIPFLQQFQGSLPDFSSLFGGGSRPTPKGGRGEGQGVFRLGNPAAFDNGQSRTNRSRTSQTTFNYSPTFNFESGNQGGERSLTPEERRLKDKIESFEEELRRGF